MGSKFSFKKAFSGKSLFSNDSIKRNFIAQGLTGGTGGLGTTYLMGDDLWDYRADNSGTSSVRNTREKRKGDAADVQAAADEAARQQREEQARKDAEQAQKDQLAARRRNRRFAYGSDRGGSPGELGAVDGQKSLLGY